MDSLNFDRAKRELERQLQKAAKEYSATIKKLEDRLAKAERRADIAFDTMLAMLRDLRDSGALTPEKAGRLARSISERHQMERIQLPTRTTNPLVMLTAALDQPKGP